MRIAGSALIGQPFDGPQYFWSRPSATAPFAYNAAASSGSNYGPSNDDLLKAVEGRIDALEEPGPEENPIVVTIDARPGDVAHLLSDDPLHGAPSISDLASLMETNSYELLTGIRRRIPRVYERAGSIVAVQTAEAEYDLAHRNLPAATVGD